MKKVVCLLPLIALLGTLTFATDKKQPAVGKVVDSGSFGVFVNGKRVATEKFEISQMADGSIARSELSAGDGTGKAEQKSELLLSPSGDLKHYSWNELAPGTGSATVDPQNQILVERVLTMPNDPKPFDQPFILSASAAILDDYFFSQRELLAWRYLGAGCRQESGETKCNLTKTQFPALIPRQRTSLLVSLEYVGKETVVIRGQQVELNRFNLQGEAMDWGLWLDDSYKIVRIVIAGEQTEVLRD